MKGYFVTGTDTEIGKTYSSVSLIQSLVKQGYKVSGLKPIASGCEQTAQGLRNEDALKLIQASNVELPYSVVNRYSFVPAIAPHIAAAETHTRLEFEAIKEDVAKASALSDICVVEGVGGWLVPLDNRQTVEDLAITLDLPVILIVGIRLGCINQALLTYDRIIRSGLPFVGWVANCCIPETECIEEQIESLTARINAPLLAKLSYGDSTNQQVNWQITP